MSDQAPLGKNTSIASVRVRRFALQSVARRLLPGEKVVMCLRWTLGCPEVWYSPVSQRAHYKKLMVCGRVWTCPVCATKITEGRRIEANQAIKAWQASVFMATFTLQHTRNDECKVITEKLNKAFRTLKSGRWWQDFVTRYQLAGSISSHELTVSTSAGWHPHKHVLFFSRLSPSNLDTKKMQAELSERFAYIMAKDGGYVSAIYGVKVERALDAQSEGDQALKSYVAKWGLGEELTKGPVKSGKVENGLMHLSPFQLLDLAGQGDKWASAMFREYAEAMKGKNQLVWSRGLRKLLKLQEVEKTDEELAEEKLSVGDVILAQLTLQQWGVIVVSDARAELLNIADSGDAGRVRDFLDRIGAGSEVWQLAPP